MSPRIHNRDENIKNIMNSNNKFQTRSRQNKVNPNSKMIPIKKKNIHYQKGLYTIQKHTKNSKSGYQSNQ